jgi:hypothetical protein
VLVGPAGLAVLLRRRGVDQPEIAVVDLPVRVDVVTEMDDARAIRDGRERNAAADRGDSERTAEEQRPAPTATPDSPR